MITNSNSSKTPGEGNFLDVKKFIGVGSVNVLSINPDNKTLRKYGWSVPENAPEPNYVVTDSEGKKSARVRFLVQIQDMEEKPIVGMDYWIRPDVVFNRDNTKCKIIDSYGRTAYGTKVEVQAHKVPEYANGPANISSDYKPCHVGEEELISFLMKYLNITPLQMWSKVENKFVATKDPGKLTIDNWQKLCNGDVSELKQYISLQPDNKVKVVFGVRTTDDNKSYQTFLSTKYFGNGSIADRNTGEYTAARKAIDEFFKVRPNSPVSFSAAPIKEWSVSATDVKENEDMPSSFSDTSFFTEQTDDLPFSD